MIPILIKGSDVVFNTNPETYPGSHDPQSTLSQHPVLDYDLSPETWETARAHEEIMAASMTESDDHANR